MNKNEMLVEIAKSIWFFLMMTGLLYLMAFL